MKICDILIVFLALAIKIHLSHGAEHRNLQNKETSDVHPKMDSMKSDELEVTKKAKIRETCSEPTSLCKKYKGKCIQESRICNGLEITKGCNKDEGCKCCIKGCPRQSRCNNEVNGKCKAECSGKFEDSGESCNLSGEGVNCKCCIKKCKPKNTCRSRDGTKGTCSRIGCKMDEREIPNGCKPNGCTCCVKDELVSTFITQFHKVYSSEEEREMRIGIFQENAKAIGEHNQLYESGESSYSMGINEYSDMTYDEIIDKLTGLNVSAESRELRQSNGWYVPIDLGNEPSSLDYRSQGAVNPIRDQGQCGSCWAFSTISSIESILFLKTGKLAKFSEQDLVDCSDAGSCSGGWTNRAIDHIATHGIAHRDEYPYTASDDSCSEAVTKSFYVKAHQQVQQSREDELLNALVHVGPISIAYYVSKNFPGYNGGIFFDENCLVNDWVNHAMTLVGYGTENGQDYWLIRNSWGTNWGDNGYIKVARNKDDHCRIAKYADIPIIEDVCPEGTFLFPQSNQCFKLLTGKKHSWYEAKQECQKQGLALARPTLPVALRSYLVTTYGDDVETWINAKSNGIDFVWQNDGEVIPKDDPLWWPGKPGDRTSDQYCLVLRARKKFMEEQPDKPFWPSRCGWPGLLPLCEVVMD